MDLTFIDRHDLHNNPPSDTCQMEEQKIGCIDEQLARWLTFATLRHCQEVCCLTRHKKARVSPSFFPASSPRLPKSS